MDGTVDQAKPEKATAVRALRVEIARPVDITWDELGTLLRTQRKIMHQILRAGMDARIACGVVGVENVKAKVAPEVEGKSAESMVYRAMFAELHRIKENRWSEEVRPALELPGGMISALSHRVMQSYKKRSGFNSEQPIPVRKAELAVKLVTDGDRERVVLDLKLTSKGRTRVYARPSKGSHWHTLKQIAKGEIQHCDCQVVLDEHRNKWYAILAYEQMKKPLNAVVDPKRVLVVHRGVRHALTFLCNDGGRVEYLNGDKLMGQLSQLRERLRKAQHVSLAELGSGARGHGKDRRSEPYDSFDNKRKAVIKTWCQQTAAFILQLLVKYGAGVLVIEDYDGVKPSSDPTLRQVLERFPLFQLKQMLKNALEVKACNVELREVPAEYISTTCLACGNADDRQHNRRTGVFHCRQCGFERPADFVAAIHMLRRSGADTTVWDERHKRAEALRRSIEEDDEPEPPKKKR